MDYSSHAMIIGNTGGAMHKAKGAMRAEMPSWALQIRRHYQLQEFSGPFDAKMLEDTSRMLRYELVPCDLCILCWRC